MVDKIDTTTELVENEMDFLTLLEESFAIEQPRRGDITMGTVLSVDPIGLLVDLGMKRDGMVTRNDLDRLDDDFVVAVGDKIPVMIIRSEDAEGNMIVSVAQAKQNEDWLRADEIMNDGTVWEGEVADANRGGLIVLFGNLRGFVPASHVADMPRGMSEEKRIEHLNTLIGQSLAAKVIEVNRQRRRLVLSQREAQREHREAQKSKLLESMKEGEIRTGVVSGLRDFGAFIDLGGADGLVHISELAWHRVKHPREVLDVGDEIEVFVLRLDQEGRRIGLSLKRLQPNPWSQVDDLYHVGQLVEGTISRVTQFGAFVSLEPGIEALLHVSQISSPPPADPTTLLHDDQTLTARIISIEPQRQRLGLSIRDVDNPHIFAEEFDEALDTTESMIAEELDEALDTTESMIAEELDEALDTTESMIAEELDETAEVAVAALETDSDEIETGQSDPDTVEFDKVEPPVAKEESIAE